MRPIRMSMISLALLSLASACLAEDPKSLGHHWHVPAYRVEMQAQICIMAGIALAIVGSLWIKRIVQTRRSRQ